MKLTALKMVITGAASGLGRHCVTQLLDEGASVSAWDLDLEGLRSLQAQYPDAPLHVAQLDVADEVQVVAAMREAWWALGGLNGLVNNAEIFRDASLVKRDRASGALRSMSLEQWQTVLDVDLTGPFLCTRALSELLLEADVHESAVIVNVTSVSRAGNRGQGNYSAAKAALVASTVTWAQEFARDRIRVAALAPGFIRTPPLEGMRPEMVDQTVARVPLRRLGEVEEVYAGLRFIIECDYFTGRCLEIDGGLRL